MPQDIISYGNLRKLVLFSGMKSIQPILETIKTQTPFVVKIALNRPKQITSIVQKAHGLLMMLLILLMENVLKS